MNGVIFTFSVLAIGYLLTFRTKENQRKKPIFNIIALVLVVMFALQLYNIHHSTIFNLIATLVFSIPIILCHGNVSEAWQEVKYVLCKLKGRL